MKAIVYRRYGTADVLRCEEIDRPTFGDNGVRIRVRAAGVNPLDWHFMRGTPYLVRLMTGLRKPTIEILGVDTAGEIEAVGRNVTKFKPGDEVFGTSRGAFAEYVCTTESRLVLKPHNVTFAQAAAVPIAAVTALQGLRDKGRIQAGQKVLINGAAGGVGTFAVQIAKSFGASVTGICSTRNVDLVRSIGADKVIDYASEDFTETQREYDLFLDAIGNHALSACLRVLKRHGTYVGVGGPESGRWIGPLIDMLKTRIASTFVSENVFGLLAKLNTKDLLALRDLIESGKVTPVIDRRYDLHEVPDAIRYLEAGHARGKVVITME